LMLNQYGMAERRFGPSGVAGVYGAGPVADGPDGAAARRIGWVGLETGDTNFRPLLLPSFRETQRKATLDHSPSPFRRSAIRAAVEKHQAPMKAAIIMVAD
jgi:hypothetical protein